MLSLHPVDPLAPIMTLPNSNAGTSVSELLLSLVRCPITQSALTPATQDLLERLNRAVAAKSLCDASGRTVEKSFEAGLVNATQVNFFPVTDGILQMVVEECIELDQLNHH